MARLKPKKRKERARALTSRALEEGGCCDNSEHKPSSHSIQTWDARNSSNSCFDREWSFFFALSLSSDHLKCLKCDNRRFCTVHFQLTVYKYVSYPSPPNPRRLRRAYQYPRSKTETKLTAKNLEVLPSTRRLSWQQYHTFVTYSSTMSISIATLTPSKAIQHAG